MKQMWDAKLRFNSGAYYMRLYASLRVARIARNAKECQMFPDSKQQCNTTQSIYKARGSDLYASVP